MMFGSYFTIHHLNQNQFKVQMLQQDQQIMNASYITVYSSPLRPIVPFILRIQTINFLTHIVHLLIAAVIQMVDLSTLTVIVPLSNTEHVATNQKQTLKKDIIHMFT